MKILLGDSGHVYVQNIIALYNHHINEVCWERFKMKGIRFIQHGPSSCTLDGNRHVSAESNIIEPRESP
jgi:hypothetical protein